ncbi:MAG: hypothetical protein NE328_24500 [Lentisphaeraceae bacterium]|nr:hypothetical protein [Lentisphaeraceae bacterium]
MFTIVDHSVPILDSKSVNSIENLAIHLAAGFNGQLSATQLLPYFSLPLKELDKCLSDMVDNSSVLKSVEKGLTVYQFKNISEKLLPGVNLSAIKMELPDKDIRSTKLEHQIVHAAHNAEGRISAESIAVNTEFTLSEVKETLKRMSIEKYISQGLNEDDGSIYYIFPKTEYFDKNFKDNMQFLRLEDPVESFDAKAAVFFKYMFICLIMIGLLFFAKVNFRFLIILFLISMPISALMTYFNYKK